MNARRDYLAHWLIALYWFGVCIVLFQAFRP